MSALFSTFTEVGMVDARNRPGTLTLPLTTQIPYRTLTIKDIYGAAVFSTITVQTQGSDLFEDGTTSKLLTDAYETFTVYAGQAGRWYITGGTKITAATIGTLTVSTVFGLQNLVSTNYLQTQLGSTVVGLGTAGYLSSLPGGLVSTANLSDLVSTTYLATQLGSTVVGLGTAGYISSSQLLSTSLGLTQYISSFIDPTELTSTVIGLGTQGFVSSLGLTYAVASTAQGLGTFGYTSTSQLLSTSLGLYQEIQNSPTALVQANLTSTIIGLGTFGYISTVSLGSLVSTANLANLVSTANLTNLVSTANLANLVSTANLANLVSTANLANLVSTANLANLVSCDTTWIHCKRSRYSWLFIKH